ncbi:MarR family winged helix-turn-helix transcriptional regulator [Pseudoroseicyclus aestuarii]|uniref:MarR family transcriptional regulator n=1 Tax=Pseudoroseicyclus aestuarii TaxID=1795041 RepID=A0A318SWY6_9RHOB|nr:MarR family transcriptional regulator [Pseudoroseicyclus aestuarii]PYE84337.1 MarR family transcriptional regulator [Pseudoroseicyclus aestuarii]
MSRPTEALAVSLFSEILAVDQLARNTMARVLPKGMELSHFSVLNHLAFAQGERSPAQLARTFHLSRSAMTNTLGKLEWNGWVHIRPDWEDARRKMVSISASGQVARDAAVASITPLISDVVDRVGAERARAALPILRELRLRLGEVD